MLRRFVLMLSLVILMVQAYCQQPSFIAPNFTFTDVNGNSHTLYDYLDQGKTVFFDAFTTWCNPCWNYHNSHAFADLYQLHGPAGMNGVSAGTTNDVMVFAIEVESSNATSAIFGGGSALVTQGNWTSGVSYPIIDIPPSQVASFCGLWDIDSYPTIYRVCRDRIATRVSASSASTLYQGMQSGCPAYAPTAAADAKYFKMRSPAFHCGVAAPEIIFQNYSTQSLQNVKVKTYYDYILIDSFQWTGNAAPMDFVNVTLPSMSLPASTERFPFSFKVTANNDIRATNDYSGKVYDTRNYQNPESLPFYETFNPPSQSFSQKWVLSGKLFTTIGGGIIGSDGMEAPIVLAAVNAHIPPGYKDTMYAGNYNLQGITNPKLSFDLCYSQMFSGSTYSNDKLGVMVSTDCGAHWISLWNKSGSQLATTAPSPLMYFAPIAANQWQKQVISLFPAANEPNVVLAFTGESDLGSNVFIDNIALNAGSLGVNYFDKQIALQLYPNPATDEVHVTIHGSRGAVGKVVVYDLFGQSVKEHAVSFIKQETLAIDISDLQSSQYFLSITVDDKTYRQSFVKR